MTRSAAGPRQAVLDQPPSERGPIVRSLRVLGSRPCRTAIAVVLAIVGWILFVNTTVGITTNIKVLAIPVSPVPGFGPKPANLSVAKANQSQFAAVRRAAVAAPDKTAEMVTSFTDPNNSGSAGLQLEYLPTTAQAVSVASEAKSQFLSTDFLKSAQYIRTSTFTLPSVPNFEGAHFKAPKSSHAGDGEFGVFRVDNTVVIESIMTTAKDIRAVTTAFAEAQANRLEQLLPDFSPTSTQKPLIGSIIYFLVAAVIIAALWFIPESIVNSRERRQHHRVSATRSHYQSRGSKVLRQQRARGGRR